MIRIALTAFTILSVSCLHLVSKYPPETPISEELARRNPVAIFFMVSLIMLLVHMIIDGVRSGNFIGGWSLLPIIPCLAAIAFTSPSSALHINLFAAVATYGFIWLTVSAFFEKRWEIGLMSGFLALFSLVTLGLYSIIDRILPYSNLDPPSLGYFQKGLILLFAFFATGRSGSEDMSS